MNYRVWIGTGHTEMPLADAIDWVITYDEHSTHVLGAIVGAIVARMRDAGMVDDDWVERAAGRRLEAIPPTQEPPQCQ